MTDKIIVKKPGFGLRLKNAREQSNLSEKDAALRLCLKSNIITLIENEDFVGAPPITFMRGYVRSYARLLNFSEAEINTGLEQLGLGGVPPSSTLSLARTTGFPSSEERYPSWLTYVIITAIIALIGIWWNSHSLATHQNPADTTNTIATTPADIQPAPANVNTATTTQASAVAPVETTTPPLNMSKNASQPTSPSINQQGTRSTTDIESMAMALPEPGLESADVTKHVAEATSPAPNAIDNGDNSSSEDDNTN